MLYTHAQRLQALSRWCAVLAAWRVRHETALSSWTLTLNGHASAPIALGNPWTPTSDDHPALFELDLVLEQTMSDAQLELDLGGEGDVSVDLDGSLVAAGGLNPFHRTFLIGSVRAGQRLQVRAEVVARGLFGRPTPEPSLTVARLVTPERELLLLLMDLQIAVEVCRELEQHNAGLVPQLLGAAEEAISRLVWPSDTAQVLGRGVPVLGEWYASGIWRLPPFPPAQPLPEEARASVVRARAQFQLELQKLKALHPSVGRVALSGHAHLDLAWLWPVHETRRKLRRTFRTVLSLMEEDPHFTFNQSSAQVYAWLEQDEPELFARVRERVLEGRIETVGGSWVEPDGQMPSGESWARQLLYGQRYFQERFGRRSSVHWLPDTFGYTPALPQLLAQAGIDGFFTTKLSWNETNRFPHDLFFWEGLDGTRTLAHMFFNPGGTDDGTGAYNAELRARDLHGTWTNFRGKDLRAWDDAGPVSLMTFGYGDGGGGPSREHLERFEQLKEYPGMPKLEYTRVDDFYRQLPRTDLPVWVGELYLELHRATLTSQGRVKKLHREAEHRLVEAEVAASFAWLAGRPYPQGRLETAWKTLLLNQFHDILPGSSIREVYDTTIAELQGVVAEAASISEASGPLRNKVATPSVQMAARAWQNGAQYLLKNEALLVQVGADGTLSRVIDLTLNREVLSSDGNVLTAYPDLPREWEAWDTSTAVGDTGEEVRAVERIEVIEAGSACAAVRVTRRWRSSQVVQTYRLAASSRRLEIETHLDWHERRTLLRAVFPLGVLAREATFETAFGCISRPTHRNTSWDEARFEVCGHRWADLSQPDYGVALLNDGKYGHSVLGSTLALSLVRGPVFPDPYADEGEQHFTYALYPHGGDARSGQVAFEALALNSPDLASWCGAMHHPVRWLNSSVLIAALKKAEDLDALVLRAYEPYGADAVLEAEVTGLRRAWRVNLLEDRSEDVAVAVGVGGRLQIPLKPFEVVSLLLEIDREGLQPSET